MNCVSLKASLLILVFLVVVSCGVKTVFETGNPLENKVICIDPGHGGTADVDDYRVGPTGEREEWINLRVALILKEMLENRAARVLMTRIEDVQVGLKERAILAVDNNADVFVSIHHNATADRNVNFPIIYYHCNASGNSASVQLGKCLALRLSESLYNNKTPVSLVSDHTIFPNSGTAVLRHSYGIPGVICEASFFTNPEEEQRLKDENYNRQEAEAYLRALEDYFRKKHPPIKRKYSAGKIKPFKVLQESERMDEVAKKWEGDFNKGKELMEKGNPESLQKAYGLFTRSARSFPDSYVARECHLYRAEILAKLGKQKESEEERKRVKEYYVNIGLNN